MSDDEVVYLPSADIRGELGPLLDQAIFEIAPNEQIMWDISYTVMPVYENNRMVGEQVGGLLVLTAPGPIVGEPLIAGTRCNHRKLLADPSRVSTMVADLVDILRGQSMRLVREQIEQIKRQPPPGQPG